MKLVCVRKYYIKSPFLGDMIWYDFQKPLTLRQRQEFKNYALFVNIQITVFSDSICLRDKADEQGIETYFNISVERTIGYVQ